MRYKRPVVQLTTLLDLLFIMIFVSLNNTKATEAPPAPAPRPEVAIVEEKVEPVKETPKEAPVEEPAVFFVSAEFFFYPTPNNPNVPSGTYKMNGQFERSTGELQLAGAKWIKRPQGPAAHIDIEMVPLSGVIDSSKTVFTGRVEAPDCQQFKLKRITTEGSENISGKWKGTYDCLQGETGLTLTIY